MNTGTNTQRSLWPHAIICWFALFITAIVVWIVYASRQRMDLVNSDYYAQEILYQNRIDAAARAHGKAELAYDAAKQLITIQIPDAQKISDGEIHFYCPNNAKLDHTLKLALNAGTQQLDSRSLRAGLWKVRVHWKADGADFYSDKSIVIAPQS
jgi:nitrogen fixation protein FixH